MSTPTVRSTPRREFIGQLTASAILLASSACASSAAASASSTTPTPAGPAPTPTSPLQQHWDDSWFGRLTAKHKAVFDSPEIEDGTALEHAAGYISGMRAALGAGSNDVQSVVVIRHAAIPMVLNDAMWSKYQIGKDKKVKDDSTKKWATRNPFFDAPSLSGKTPTPPGTPELPRATLNWLAAHGQTLLGCDLATRWYAGVIADKTKATMATVYEELKANLVPGVILQPSGVYAVHRAQEAGCTFIRST